MRAVPGDARDLRPVITAMIATAVLLPLLTAGALHLPEGPTPSCARVQDVRRALERLGVPLEARDGMARWGEDEDGLWVEIRTPARVDPVGRRVAQASCDDLPDIIAAIIDRATAPVDADTLAADPGPRASDPARRSGPAQPSTAAAPPARSAAGLSAHGRAGREAPEIEVNAAPGLLVPGRAVPAIEAEALLWFWRSAGASVLAGAALPAAYSQAGATVSLTHLYAGLGGALCVLQANGWRLLARADVLLDALGAGSDAGFSAHATTWMAWPGLRAGVRAFHAAGPIELGLAASVWSMLGGRVLTAQPGVDVARIPPLFPEVSLVLAYRSGTPGTRSEAGE